MRYLDDEVQGFMMHPSPAPGLSKNARIVAGTGCSGHDIPLPLVIVWPGCGKPRRVYAEIEDGTTLRRYVVGTGKKREDRRYLRDEVYPGLFGEGFHDEAGEKQAKLAMMKQETSANRHPLCNDAMHLKQFVAGMSDAMCFRPKGNCDDLGMITWRLAEAYRRGWTKGKAHLEAIGKADHVPTKRVGKRY